MLRGEVRLQVTAALMFGGGGLALWASYILGLSDSKAPSLAALVALLSFGLSIWCAVTLYLNRNILWRRLLWMAPTVLAAIGVTVGLGIWGKEIYVSLLGQPGGDDGAAGIYPFVLLILTSVNSAASGAVAYFADTRKTPRSQRRPVPDSRLGGRTGTSRNTRPGRPQNPRSQERSKGRSGGANRKRGRRK